MTWRKTGSEFDDECANLELSDAAYRTHMEAIGWIYQVEQMPCRIPKHNVRRFASSRDTEAAIKELVAIGFWVDHGNAFEVMHHADVIRQSLAAQQRQRQTSKRTSAKYRAKKSESDTDESPEVTRHVTPNADRQTDKHLEGDHLSCVHGVTQGNVPDPWFKNGMACDQCAGRKAG